jgi:fibronectin type 3 domain-containing protein
VTISGDGNPPTVPSNPAAVPGGIPASIIARQSYINTTSLTSHSTGSFDSTGGNLIVVFGSSHANVTMTLTDNRGNSWISAAGPTNHVPGADLRSQVWYARTPNVGTGHTVTMNLSIAQPVVMSVLVIKGSDSVAPIDVISSITDDGGIATPIITSASVNTTKPGDLLIDFGKVAVGVTWTAGAAYTFEGAASSNYLAAEDALAGLPGTYNASWTTDLPVNWQNVLLGVASANASTGSTQITLIWSPSTDDTGVTNYHIERCTGSGCSTFSEVGVTGSPNPSFTDINLSVGTTYIYRIRARDAAGNFSGYSNPISATTVDPVAPLAPSNLTTTTASASQINLSWTASTDNIAVTGYRIERCQNAGCSNFVQIQTSTSASYSDTGLSPATSYSYRVRATDAQGNLSGYSNTASGATDTPPTAPSTLAATAASGTQINLTWTASTSSIGISNYLLERCQGAGCSNFAQIGTSTTTTYSDTGLTPATTYSYRARATDTHNNLSGYSNTTSAATLDTVLPSAPSNLTSTTISTSQINLAWTASTDNVSVTGYRVERCQGAGCSTFTEIATPAGTSYNNTGLAASTTYSYRVRATDAAGNLSGYSNVTTATTQATPPANGPAAAYAFTEGTGSTTADASGNSLTGTLTNGPAWIAGHTGNAISFDGVDDRVSIPSTLDVTTLPFTLEAWVRPVNRSSWHVIFSKRSSYSAAGMRFDVGLADSTGTVYVTTFTTTRTFTYAPPLNTWTHLAVVADSTGTRLYVGGVLQQSLGVITLGTGSTAAVGIGRTGDNDDPFAGAIDDLRFYKRSLTLAEIQTDMNTPVQ